MMNKKFRIAENTILGQQKVKNELELILSSDRIGHAYIIAGPQGIGKKGLALAFAEAVNGITNFSDLGELTFSKKSSWFTHPDIHLFLPIPRLATEQELMERVKLLSEDPYAVVDYANRPELSGDSSSLNKKAFYSVEYFNDNIRPKVFLKPNEGRRNVIILSNIELMPEKTVNSFLKILEEPPNDLLFILTTDNINTIIPTIVSRCQILRCSLISNDEIEKNLIEKDHCSVEDAAYLAKISDGNYAIVRYFDVEKIKDNRKDVIHFIRMSYLMDASELNPIILRWSNDNNSEGIFAIFTMIELFLKDLYVYRQSQDGNLVVNSDKLDVIEKFNATVKEARLTEMIELIDDFRDQLKYNVNAKLLFTVLAFRFAFLMRGLNTPIHKDEPWKHFPNFSTSLS